jgi:exodeoxyribonuclease V alpha subunit
VKNIYTGSADEKLAVGDKVIQMENNYELDVFNGDVGIVSKVNEKALDDDVYLTVSMLGRTVTYIRSDVSQLSLAYCITGHKSQGSEYPYTLIVFPDHYYALMDRYWLNTLVTRCQKHTTIIGPRGIVEKTVRSTLSKERVTNLKEQLRLFADKAPMPLNA